jgi:endonuclease/exonuclease/phosphatase family metal-dependent hydrolase
MRRLGVVSYNIHRAVGLDGRQSPERIGALLAPLDADVIALQELHAHAHPRGWMEHLDYLAEVTQMNAVAGPTLVRHAGRYGNGLLTRLPIRATRSLDLSHPHREPRGAVEALLDVDGVPLAAVVTHLGLLPWERHEQVARLVSWLAKSRAEAMVLMGDFNEWRPRSPRLACLDAALAPSRAVPTYPAFLPVWPLDRIWARWPAELLRISTVRGPGVRVASDHLPLQAEVALFAGYNETQRPKRGSPGSGSQV